MMSPEDKHQDPSQEGAVPAPTETPLHEEGATMSIPEEFQNDATAALVGKAQEGDPNALNDLFRRYHQTMVEVARRKLGPRLRVKEDPDDLAQTTFREATRDFKSYRYQGEGSLLRWLIQILQNKIRDKAEFYSAGKRDLGRERTMDAPAEQRDDGVPSLREIKSSDLSVTQAVARDENFDMLRLAIGDLSGDHRQAITLVFFEGLSLREAGTRMGGKSEDAVRMMLRRAEVKLGEKLKTLMGQEG